MTEWIGATEAARRLGIKEASLYSYVSRGLLSRRKAEGSRSSLFDAADVERLAGRGRSRGGAVDGRPDGAGNSPGQSARAEVAAWPGSRGRAGRFGPGELVVETAVTEIDGDVLRYRGHDAVALAAGCSLEQVAYLLWTGSPGPPGAQEPPWRATDEALAAGTAAQAALPAATLPLERLQVIVPALAAADPLRLHLDPPAVMAAGRSLVAGMTDCLPWPGADDGAGFRGGAGGIARRLAAKLCPGTPAPGLVDVVRAALVLLADHELAASTLAARVAASMRADPYAVVATGLGAMGGALHGGASFGAEVMLRSAVRPADAARVVGELLRRGERIPGFGHFVYVDHDPRAVCLLAMLREVVPGSMPLAIAEAVVAEARTRALPMPNIDFALATLATAGNMISGAGEAIFAVARAAGWLAHALEEYARNMPIRPRGIYTGPIVRPPSSA